MTAVQLANYPKSMISTRMAAQIIGINPYWFVCRAKEGKLPFRYEFSGNRLHINKYDFMRYCGYAVDGTALKGE